MWLQHSLCSTVMPFSAFSWHFNLIKLMWCWPVLKWSTQRFNLTLVCLSVGGIFVGSPHPPPLSAGRAGRGPLCQPRPPWVHCPPAPLQTSACPVGWVRCMMRTRLFALKTALDSLQGFLPSSWTRYKSHKSCV